jgi:hypothetical protein
MYGRAFDPRPALSKQLIAVGAVILILAAAAAGYFVLRPSSSAASSRNQTDIASGVGSTRDNPVSAFALYNDYNLGGNATDYPQFTNHGLYAKGNILSIVIDPKTNTTETQIATGASLFEYWDWQVGAALPTLAGNQAVLAHCFVRGLVTSQNGTAFLYLNNCALLSIQGANA